MKIIYEIERDSDDYGEFDFKKRAYHNAESNQLFIETMYNDYFRKHIKYGDEEYSKVASEIWQEVANGIYEGQD